MNAYRILLVCWIVGAALYMGHFKGGFLTNYLSDLTFPAWFYIFIRGLNANHTTPKLLIFGNWFGQSAERAAISIFLVGVVTELKTLYWPGGLITGTWDPFDILAYAVSLAVCYVLDRLLK